jgi:capsular polysaccharide transport system permease protein
MSAEPIITPPGPLTPQQRAQFVSRQLSEAARILRFSSGRRGASDGFRARRGQRFVRLFVIATFLLAVAIPSTCAVVYYGLWASNQYVAEARFAVRSGVTAGLDALTAMTGVPSVQIIQDTQVVTNYVASRTLVDHLIATANLKEVFAHPEADYFSRLDPDMPIERIARYWRRMSAANIRMPGGIVELEVRAFTPDDAVRLANAVVAASEQLINDMNERSRREALEHATREHELAAKRLAAVRGALEVVRNQEGMLDATAETNKAGLVFAAVRTQLLQLQAQYNASKGTISADAPQMRNLRLQIQAAERQIEQLQGELTRTASAEGPTLSASMTRLATTNLERQVAEAQYTSATSALERARAASLSKQIYLTSFVKPVPAELPRYPRRAWIIAGTVVAGLVGWAVLCGLAAVIRNNMA